MKRFLWFSCVCGAIALHQSGRVAWAQGVTSAAVAGRLSDEAGAAVASASVTLVNGSTGQRYSRRSAEDGRYNFENVEVGGPYTLEVRALGFEAAKSAPFQLALGQRSAVHLTLKRAAVEVAAVTITAQADPLLSTGRTGAQTLISDSALRRLPTLNRSFDNFLSATPQVVGRSFTGQNDRFNNIQIDGTVNNDLFNLGASNGSPGGGVNARPLSLEAIKEYQVLIAPFDVRQGGFVGGLVNAITKSGTNAFHGSAFGYGQNQNFVGTDTAGVSVPVSDYQQQQYGFTVGGPIIRDRLHFFVSGDLRHDNRPFASSVQIGPDPSNPVDTAGVGITQARADSVRTILQGLPNGFDPGDWHAPQINNPETNLFAKLDYELGTNSHLELSGTFVSANQDKLIHSYRLGYTSPPTFANARDGYELSNSGYAVQNHTRTVRANWTTAFANRFSNELIVGRTTISDDRPPDVPQPLILVWGNSPYAYLAAGAERFSHANILDQRVVEATDNLTFSLGRHLFTLGTHNEFIHFRNVFFPASIGIWSFASPAALALGTPNMYARALPGVLRPDGPVADFDVTQIGFYGEDRFSPLPNLDLTVGLRADVPSLPVPAYNAVIEDSLGVNTSSTPSGNVLWSPRLGFHYDVGGRQEIVFRGGAGVFSGRPPYVWVSNAYGNTGLEQQTLFCDGAASTANNNSSFDTVPAFTLDPNNQPLTCGGTNQIGPSSAATSIVFYDPDFKFPQSLKVALGVDRSLPWHLFATVDFVFTKAINQYYLQDVNLVGVQSTSTGEGGRAGTGGRPLYGTINASNGRSTPTRATSKANDVVENRNVSEDQSTSLTFQLQKRFSDGIEFSAAYTYSHALDVISMTSDITGSNFSNAVVDGTLENRNLARSQFDRPHKVTVSGTINAPFDTRFSLIYNGVSGTPFTYMVSGDANADGVTTNDPVYVPRSALDISLQNPPDWPTLDAFINNEPCLNNNRGRILPRNGCRNGWQNILNARLSKVVPTVHGQSIEVTADMLNVLNFINSSWGLIRQTGIFENSPNLLRLVGYDTTNNRGKYALSIPVKDQVQINSIGSRWVFQLGMRYTF